MHDTREIPSESTRRDVAVTLVGTFVFLLVLNVLAGWYLRHFPRNRGSLVIGRKWEHLEAGGSKVDWPVFGDSTGLQGVDPEVLGEELGGTSHNYCVVGHLSITNTAWMMGEHVRRHGPPEGAVVIHALDVWRREIAPVLLARFPHDWGFWNRMDPPVHLDVRQRAQYAVSRYLTLYSENISLAELLSNPWDIGRFGFNLRGDGYLVWTEPTPEVLERDLGHQRKLMASERFRISPNNAVALERIGRLAEEHDFPVYLIAPPLYEQMAALDGFSRYYSDMLAVAAEYAAKHRRVHFLLRGPNLHPASEVQNTDHLLREIDENSALHAAGDAVASRRMPDRAGEPPRGGRQGPDRTHRRGREGALEDQGHGVGQEVRGQAPRARHPRQPDLRQVAQHRLPLRGGGAADRDEVRQVARPRHGPDAARGRRPALESGGHADRHRRGRGDPRRRALNERNPMRILIFVPLLLLAAGCGGSEQEAALEESIDVMNEMADVLSSVKDKASAESARSELQDLAERMQDVQKKMKSIGEPNEEESKRIFEKYGMKLMEATQRLMAAMEGVSANQEAMKVLGEELGKLTPGR
jgi:hypothetical protein